jgi:hypothetical protein
LTPHLDQLVDLPSWDHGLKIDRQIDDVRREVQSAIGGLEPGREADDVDQAFDNYIATVDKLRDLYATAEGIFHTVREAYDEAITIADRLFELQPWRMTISDTSPHYKALRGAPPMWLEENLHDAVEIFPLAGHLIIVFGNEADMTLFRLKYA